MPNESGYAPGTYGGDAQSMMASSEKPRAVISDIRNGLESIVRQEVINCDIISVKSLQRFISTAKNHRFHTTKQETMLHGGSQAQMMEFGLKEGCEDECYDISVAWNVYNLA